MRISDWSSDVCSSDLLRVAALLGQQPQAAVVWHPAEVIEGPVDPARIAEPVSGAQRFVGRIEADDPTVLVVDRTQRDRGAIAKIGREHVCTPVTNAHLVCRLLLEKKNKHKRQHQKY